MKTRILCLLIISLWMFQSIAPYIALQWHRITQWEKISRISNHQESLEVVTLYFEHGTNIHWEKPGREFVLDGHMYDVMSMSTEDGRIKVKCKRDHKEDRLRKAQGRSADHQALLIKTLRKLHQFFQTPPFLTFHHVVIRPFSPYISTPLPILYGEVDAPPPDSHLLRS
ncbi:hypothetical protein [Marinoscillum luteum]|uniref:Uncharacterized protein n=1 Tax=Marinoscillum luteum TaxID=861051 RepID=A0ABW7NCV5_9BACT